MCLFMLSSSDQIHKANYYYTKSIFQAAPQMFMDLAEALIPREHWWLCFYLAGVANSLRVLEDSRDTACSLWGHLRDSCDGCLLTMGTSWLNGGSPETYLSRPSTNNQGYERPINVSLWRVSLLNSRHSLLPRFNWNKKHHTTCKPFKTLFPKWGKTNNLGVSWP